MDNSQAPSPLRILLVEDEPRYLESTRLLLRHYGHRVTTAVTGGQARDALAAGGFDIVLLDLRLPDATGQQILESMADQLGDTMVIVVSGDTGIDSAIGALKAGAYDFLRKPCEPEELIKTIRNAARELTLRRDHQAIRHRLERSEQWHRFLVNNSPDLIYTLDADGRITYLNECVEAITGFQKAELLGQDWTLLTVDAEQQEARWRLNERRTGERATRNHELRLRRRAPADAAENAPPHVIVELSSSGMYQGGADQRQKRFMGTYGVARDISERKRAEATIVYQAYHDLLTGLPNRALFKDRLAQAIANARRHGHLLAVMFLDLDRFKAVNDSLGHLVGDELLQLTSQRLRHCLREGDTLARIGGDEFMLLLPHIRSRDNAAHIAQKILGALQPPFHLNGHELFISASIGIAVYPDDGDQQENLIKHADIAMYSAKDQGRNDFRFFDATLNQHLSGRLAVEGDMRRGLQRGEFEMHYQPKVDIMSGRIIGMEALVRWRHPERGMVLPDEFIPIAEDTGLIAPLSEWVLHAVCDQARQWREQAIPAAALAVNLPARQIEHTDFVDQFLRVLRDHSLAGQGIEIEITESTLMRDMDGSVHKLRRLSDLGVEISIDDFGTGYSSLSYLKKLPVHSLKIDRSFVQDLDDLNGGSTIVAGIAAMAKGLKLNLVAEGVETQAQLDYLRSVGCDAYQGFLFSQAVDAAEATRMLQVLPRPNQMH
ncbi:MAG: EAL domain-containing protein [Thiobacillaceae bacterium]|nr:EAL domain-containing protein [Thiobacillaceae bacterium]